MINTLTAFSYYLLTGEDRIDDAKLDPHITLQAYTKSAAYQAAAKDRETERFKKQGEVRTVTW